MRVTVTVLNSDAPVTMSCQLINRQDGEDVYGGSAPGGGEGGLRPAQGGEDRRARPAAEEYWQDGDRSRCRTG
jgi:alpha,alpha-trehalose phosphorylase